VICPTAKAKNFCAKGWTFNAHSPGLICPSGRIDEWTASAGARRVGSMADGVIRKFIEDCDEMARRP
jgi:hypothetical protein